MNHKIRFRINYPIYDVKKEILETWICSNGIKMIGINDYIVCL